MDHDHRRDQVNVPVASQTPLRVGTVSIGEGSVISTGAIILANAWIGRYCTVAAGALVRAGHYPDHSLIAGVPAAIKPFPSRPVPNLDEPVPLDVPAGLPLEHDDPAVQAHLDAYRQAHAAAAASPTPDSYREVAYRIEPLLKTLDYVNDGELWNALQLRAAEFAAQANRFPTAAGIQS